MIKIFFDTNALTGLYAFSLDTLNQIVRGLNKIASDPQYKVIIPATVKEEYDRHYHKSRSRTGDKYPLSIFRKEFNTHKSSLTNQVKKIQPIKLSTVFDTEIDKIIEQFFCDVDSYLYRIEKELELLEAHHNNESIDDTNDILNSFVNNYSLTPITLSDKIQMAGQAETRLKNGIKPGLTDQNKKEDYRFQRYGDVFIWYEILNNSCDGDDIVFIENEKKADWWESVGGNEIAVELKEEFNERFPNSNLEMVSFYDFYIKYLDFLIDDGDAKIEINAIRDKMKDYLSGGSFVSDLEGRMIDRINEQEIEDFLLCECFDGGNVSEVNDISITKIDIDRGTSFPCYDSFDSTINDRCSANVFVECSVLSEYDKESIPATIELKLRFRIEIMYIYDIIINAKSISSVFNEEKHRIIDYEIKQKKNSTYGYDEDEIIGKYGNCTECSTPINDDNYGDGTLCYSCMISKAD